jgi:hypothetical protein
MKNKFLFFDVQEIHILAFQIAFWTNYFKDIFAYTEKAGLKYYFRIQLKQWSLYSMQKMWVSFGSHHDSFA